MNDLIVPEPGDHVGFLVFFHSSNLISVLKQLIATFSSISLKLKSVESFLKTLPLFAYPLLSNVYSSFGHIFLVGFQYFVLWDGIIYLIWLDVLYQMQVI